MGTTSPTIDAGERKTAKTGEVVPLDPAAYPELEEALATERAGQADASGTPRFSHVVICETTRLPWNRFTFGHEFRRVATAAGIPEDLQFRDLRATALTELKDADVDVLDMATHSGHRTLTMAHRYNRPSTEQFRRAAGKRVARRKKPSTP
jgi:integrase